MQMNIELECPNCIASVFQAVGSFIRHDNGPSSIVAVDVFDEEDYEGEVGAVIGWDIHPTPAQVSLFRASWNFATGLDKCVILHDAPSSIVDRPASRQHEMN